MKNSSSKIRIEFFTILIVLMPLLSVYAFPGISSLTLGEPFLLLCSLYMLLNRMASNNKRVRIYSPMYWLFITYVILVSVFNTLGIKEYSLTDTITTSLRLILYTTVIFTLSKGNIDFNLLRKAYLLVCFLSASYLIIQFLYGVFMNDYLPSTFSSLKVMYSNYTGTNYNLYLYASYRRQLFRPSSFFKEPSHLSRYLIYALPIIALKEEKRSRFEIIDFVLVLVAILITRSAMGFLGVGVFMMTWLYFDRKSKSSYMKIGVFIVAICLFMASTYFGLLDQAVGRLSSETGSGGFRIYRGFSIYSQMPLIHMIFGSGLGNYSAFADHFNIKTIYDTAGNSGNNYMNLIATTLVSSGIIGFSIYMCSLIRLIWKKSATQIACFILFVFFAFGTNLFYYSAGYILPLLFMVKNMNFINVNDNLTYKYN